MRVIASGAIAVCWAFLTTTAFCQDSQDFPKSIRLLISSKEGGGYTIYARQMEKHLPRFLPGSPSIVVQSMFGAGGVRLANYMYNAAPRDGSVLGLIQSTTGLAPIHGNQEAKFDPREFSWIGSMNVTGGYCMSWHASPIKTWQDMLSREFLVGATAANSQAATWPAMLNKLFGTKMKVVSGYGGGNEVLLGMERGEIHGRCGTLLAGIRATRPEWLDQKKLLAPITIAREREPAFPDSPSILEFAKDKDQHTRNVLEVMFKIQEIDRPLMAPPGVPENRLRILRTAFERMMKDPDFISEGEKLRLELVYGPGERVADAMKWLYTMPIEVIQDAGGSE